MDSVFYKITGVCLFLSVISIWALPGAIADGTGSGAGPAHPSAKFCIGNNGILKGVENDEGVGPSTMCRLKDDSLIEPFTLWRHAILHERTLAGMAFLNARWDSEEGAYEQWALRKCERVGGSILYYREVLRPQSGAALCVFPDKSAIEAWTLFAGPTYYHDLEKVLREGSV